MILLMLENNDEGIQCFLFDKEDEKDAKKRFGEDIFESLHDTYIDRMIPRTANEGKLYNFVFDEDDNYVLGNRGEFLSFGKLPFLTKNGLHVEKIVCCGFIG